MGYCRAARLPLTLACHTRRKSCRAAANDNNPEKKEELVATSSVGRARVLLKVAAVACLGTCLLSKGLPSAVEDARGDVWKCLISGCRQELSRCLMDPTCVANAVCLETCDLHKQIRCGDMFQSDAVSAFNTCVVSKRKCVPQKADDGKFPQPPDCSLVSELDLDKFGGEWYITSGLNPEFDTFDCQVTRFSATENVLTGNMSWRVSLPGGGFLTRNEVQRFVQNSQRPGHLEKHGNEYLHSRDDWFIVSSKFENKPDDFVFVYYRGSNDAWDGYGGAVVYTRSAQLPHSILPQLREAATKVGLQFDEFLTTDNTCRPQSSLFAKYLQPK